MEDGRGQGKKGKEGEKEGERSRYKRLRQIDIKKLK